MLVTTEVINSERTLQIDGSFSISAGKVQIFNHPSTSNLSFVSKLCQY